MKIKGERGGHYHFMAHVERKDTGDPWVAVYGGTKDPGGMRGFRYVATDQIRKVR
ncbi:DUF7246 family protein [Rhabdothermincola salaria]|uniref:DUF7246 family protein n=1 Tax=Rhabdothermincola salaria TaxID=2903142 RepID=UPI001E5B1956|nr:hypothetical protein [Rhabdothermincola salaria]MCD9625279.1 hypothetical protein [Rhabdothermincola salaria]